LNNTISELEPMQSEILLERDIHLGLATTAAVAVAAMETAARSLQGAAEPTAPTGPTPESRARGRLLAIADSYLRAESLHQALEMYFDLMVMHADTPEALKAEERTLEVALRHEQVGEMRQARAIYERLA